MLTVEELELAAKRDSNYMRTFFNYYPDLAEHEMKISKSDARFVVSDFVIAKNLPP